MGSVNQMNLNAAQQQAVTHESGPLLIVAGAGTGKTTVITQRIQYLIKEKHLDPYHLFAATFTEKAAEEMRARLDQVMPFGYREPWLGTFHGLCERLLNQEGLEIGLNPNFTILSQTDQWIFVRQHLYDFDLKYYRPLGNPTKFISALIKFFSRLTDENIPSATLINYAAKRLQQAADAADQTEAARIQELASSYQTYEKLKFDAGVLDFGDLITHSVRLLKERPNIAAKYRQTFEHLMVDEFQDTNYAQFELIKLLAPPNQNPNLVVVGDDDQCLPPTAQIITPEGTKKIADIHEGDQVLSAVGKGYTSYAPVTKVMKHQKQVRFLTITTSSGRQITLTDNHKIFCHVKRCPKVKKHYYVYLMHQAKFGWRIGITSDLCTRLHLERHMDSILAIKSCGSEAEARYFETLYSLRYSLPTVTFTARKHMMITGEWLEKLMSEIDTDTAAKKLADDLRLDLNCPHILANGINRNTANRVKVNVYLCCRNYASKTAKAGYMPKPQVSHMVHLETSDPVCIEALQQAGISLTKAKKGYRLRYQSKDLKKVITLAEQLSQITGGFIDEQASLGKENGQSLMSRIIPAKNLQLGMYIPVLHDRQLIEEEVVSIQEECKTDTVYDLEVTPTHNYIADNVVVHNSIYKFRGASVSNILEFKTVYPQAREIVLQDNYRSTQKILDSAYQSIAQNNPDRLEVKLQINKQLKSFHKAKTIPQLITFDTTEAEVTWTVQEIVRLVTQEKITYQDIAIIARANSQLEPYIAVLKSAGIPYQLIANRGLYDQEEVATLLTFLKVIADPTDTMNLFQLTQAHVFHINGDLVLTAIQTAKTSSTTLWEELKQSQDLDVAFLVQTVEQFRHQAVSTPVSRLLYTFTETTHYVDDWVKQESIENQLKLKNLNYFFNQLKRYEASTPDSSVISFLETLELWLEAGENPGQAQIEDIDTVSLMTVHAAKGLEFEAVFMGNLIAGRFPSNNRRDPIEVPDDLIKEALPEGDEHLQEERRLFYVGMTRAKRFLYLTYAEDTGGARKRKMSGFCAETGLTPITPPAVTAALPKAIQAPLPLYLDSGKPVIKTISYTQLDTFTLCPLKYKYRYLLQIPARPHHSLSFGQTIHQTLYQFHQQEMQGRKLSKDEFLALYTGNFIPEGYADPKHREARYQSGLQSMERYYEQYPALFGRPVLLEQAFKLQLDGVTFVGKIDRVDEMSDGSHQIVDYKTGEPKDQKFVDKNDQLSLYGLGAREALNLPVSDMSLYYIEGSLKLNTTRDSDDMEKVRAKLLKQIQAIQTSDFAAKPDPVKCGYCEYQPLCPFASNKNR